MKLFTYLIFVALLFACTNLVQAQEVEIEKSSNKVILQGKVYYVHIVKKGETLFSISKAYDISQKEIAIENPDIYLGLQLGQALKIPYVERSEDNKEEKFKFHIVKVKETAYSISKMYNVSLESIYENNPGSEDGLYINQVLRVPIISGAEAKENFNEESEKYYFHQIVAGETLYSIARKYDIKVRRIKRANKNINEVELPIGQFIRIPKEHSDFTESVIIQEEEDNYAGVEIQDIPIIDYVEPDVECGNQYFGRTYNVAVLLPLFIKENFKAEVEQTDSIVDPQKTEVVDEKNWDEFVSPRSKNFIEFYQGVLLAVNQLKNNGLKVNLQVFDTERSDDKTIEIINSEGFDEMDLIVGPVYPNTLRVVSMYSMENRINMISPLSQTEDLLMENPYLFQVNPSYNTQIDDFTKNISNYYESNMVMIHEGDSLNTEMVTGFKEKLFSYMSYKTPMDEVSFKELAYNSLVVHNDTINTFEHALDKSRKNVIVIPSNKEAFVNEVISNMDAFRSFGYDIEVFGFYRWSKFRAIDRGYFYSLGLNIFSPYYVDYQLEYVKNFIKQYRRSYGSEPYQYAFQGFDVSYYFLSALMKFGPDFQYCLKNHNLNLIQSNYTFKRMNGYSGFENKSVYMLKFNSDYSIKKIDY